MASADRSERSPDGVSEGTDTVEEHASEAFKLLGNQTRVGILFALWEAQDPFPEGTADPTGGMVVPFSELRERVGMRDSGQFNYHLGKLEGRFVTDTPDGYRLLPAGKKIVRAVAASAGFDEVDFEPIEIDLACQHCGAQTAVTYRDQRLYHVCTHCDGSFTLSEKHPPGVLGGWLTNPACLRDRTAGEIYEAQVTAVHHLNPVEGAGICGECSGRGELTLHVCDDHRLTAEEPCSTCGRRFDPAVRFSCTVCKSARLSSVTRFVWRHPAVISFFYERGIELAYPRKTLAMAELLHAMETEEALVSSDPLRVRVTITYDADELELVLDEKMTVIEVHEPD